MNKQKERKKEIKTHISGAVSIAIELLQELFPRKESDESLVADYLSSFPFFTEKW